MDKDPSMRGGKRRLSLAAGSIRSGFTLIELLVVLSIIVMMVAILLPVLGQAREAARAVQCLSQQRQVGIQAHYYANDYQGWIPQYWVTRPEGNPDLRLGNRTSNRFNYNQFLVHLYSDRDATSGPFGNYQCPALEAHPGNRGQVYGWRKDEDIDQSLAVYRMAPGTGAVGGWMDLQNFQSPSRAYLAADTYIESGASQDVAAINLTRLTNPFTNNRGLHLRHADSLNVLFADASASARNTDGLTDIGWRGWYDRHLYRVQP